MHIAIPEELRKILNGTPTLANAYLVGGCVRDALAGIAHHDFDIEVFGVGYEELAKSLRRWGRTDLVGRSFGVVKLTTPDGDTHDFSIPRRDSKVAPGHKGFEVTFDPAITPREAAARRDFTVNALMFDPRRNEVLDFFGGQDDWQARRLRHTSEAFVEDPLRVLRGMQFAARFDLTIAPETAALCRSIKASYRELAVERVREEWFKWAGKSTVPSRGLQLLVATEWVEHFPEIKRSLARRRIPSGIRRAMCSCTPAIASMRSCNYPRGARRRRSCASFSHSPCWRMISPSHRRRTKLYATERCGSFRPGTRKRAVRWRKRFFNGSTRRTRFGNMSSRW